MPSPDHGEAPEPAGRQPGAGPGPPPDPHLVLLALTHDLRSPIAVLEGTVERLDDLATQVEVRAMLPLLRRAGDELRAVTEDLLDAELLRLGAPVVVPHPVSLEGVIRDAAVHAGVEPQVRVDGATADVRIDPAITRRILVNLLGNAHRYNPPDGTIRVRGEVDGDHVVVTVEDDGPGIAERSRSRVFDLFHRGDADDDGDHNGVGLYLVRRLAELHGGTVLLAATGPEGGGASFRVHLRVDPDPAPSADVSDLRQPGGSGD